METVAPLFTALLALSMAISTLIRGRDRFGQQYAFLAGVIAVVYLCLFFLLRTKDETWRYGVLAGALLVAPASLQVYGQVLRRYELRFLRWVPVLYGLALVQLVLILVLTPASRLVVAANAAIVFGGLSLQVVGLWRLVRGVPLPEERRRLSDLLLTGAFAIVAVGLEMAFLDWNLWAQADPTGSIPFPPIGSLATGAYVVFLGQTILRRSLLDRHAIVSRVLVFFSLLLVVTGVYALLAGIVGPGAGLLAELVNLVIVAILLLILYEPLKPVVEKQVSRLLGRERFETVRAMEALRRRLPGLIQVDPLVDALLEGPRAAGHIDLASVYLFDDDRGGYRLRAWEGDPEHALLPQVPQRPFIDGFLEGRPWYLADELRRMQDRRGHAPLPDWTESVLATMQTMQTDLTVPLQIGPTVVGLWNLRTRPGGEGFSSEELARFHDVAEMAAVVIDNSDAFEQMKDRERLAALGEMSAGLAHEIRNPLGAIKGAVQVLAKRQGDRREEFLEIIVEEVDRLNGVVSQFLDYARPVVMHVEPLDVGLLVRGVLAMARAEGLPSGVLLAYRPGEDVPAVPMDVEKLKQVLLNLVRNGIEAMHGRGGTLTVRTVARGRGSRAGPLRAITPRPSDEVRVRRGRLGAERWVELSVEDEGSGIGPEQARKLFIPFFTTKTTGTGLGLPISERIVREHGGELEIESAPRVGTRITVRLPVPDPAGDVDTTATQPIEVVSDKD